MFIEARYFSEYFRRIPFMLLRYSFVLCLIMLIAISGCKGLEKFQKKDKTTAKKEPGKKTVKPVKPLVCFKIAKESLYYINRAGVPKGVVNQLESLTGKSFKGEEKFEKAVKEKIGWLRTIQYKPMIFAHVEKSKCETAKPKIKAVLKKPGIKPGIKKPGIKKPGTKPVRKAVNKYEIGKSADGISLKMTKIGSGKDVTLIMAAIRGNEKAGTLLINKLETYLRRHLNLLKGRTVLLIPKVNPDGYQNGTRGNSKGVDINRNFPGTNSRLQPETSSVKNVIEKYVRPKEKKRIISIRQLESIDYDGPGKSIAGRMKKYSRLRIRRWGTERGSLGYYTGRNLGIPTITFGLHKKAASYNSEKLFKHYGAALMAAILYPNDPPDDLIVRYPDDRTPDSCSEYKKAEKHYNMKNWDRSIKIARGIPEGAPCYYRAKKLIKEAIREKSGESGEQQRDEDRCLAYRKAERYLKEGKWDKAIEAAEDIPESDPCYDKRKKLIEQAESGKKKQDIAKGKKHYANKKYIEAIGILRSYENDETARDYLHKSYLQTGLSLEEKDDLRNAIEAYEKSLQYNSNCLECRERIKKCKDKYCNIHSDRGWAYYNNQELDAAKSEYQAVESVCPGFKDAKTMIEAIEGLLNN